ncbi:MAG: discoidin domain-containing protein [Oscillospiraceae bacterium]|nr:discoidin domain-containing protein [Oscillospiraceae bacterium]
MEMNFKRFLSLMLAFVMVLGMFPMGHAHAEGEAVNVLSKPVSEVQADAEYQLFYGGNRGVHGSVNTRGGFTGLDTGGNMSTTAIAGNAGYIWTLKAADGGYRLYSAHARKYAKLAGSTASMEDEADASIFVFEYDAAGTFKIKTVDGLYFNNLGGQNIMGGYGSDAVVFTIRKVLRNHTHENQEEIPAVEATLNSTGTTAGVKCADCGAVISGCESVPVKSYNDGIVPVEKLTPTAGSYNTPSHANDGGPAYALDDNLETKWHTNYSGSSGYGENTAENRWIDLAIDGSFEVTALRYKGRAGNGNITQYKISVSYDNGASYQDLVSGDWANTADWKEVVFKTPLKDATNVRLLAVASNAGHAVANEMRLVGEPTAHVCIPVEIPAVAATIGADGKTAGVKCSECGEIITAQEVIPALYKSKAVPNDAFTATVGSYETSSSTEGNANLALDDNFGTMWHTAWSGTDAENLWFDFELTEDYEVTGLYYKPRTGAHNGTILEYKIQISTDGETYTDLTTGEWADNDSWKDVSFAGQKVKHVRLFVVRGKTDQPNKKLASAAEIRLVGVPCDHYHRYTATVTAPTCTAAGYTTYTCSCGDTYTGNEVAALEHDMQLTEAQVDAKCEVAGKTAVYTCSNGCGTVTGGEEIPATGHTWGDWTETKAATLNEKGEERRDCANCDAFETQEIPVLTGAVAEVNGVKYATFEEALEVAMGVLPITLLKDEGVVVTTNTTYDLGASIITAKGDAFTVTNGATLTLNGGIISAGEYGVGSWTAVWANGGHAVINGGIYTVGGDTTSSDATHQNDVIYTKNGGTVVINGGAFMNDGTVWTLNKHDSTGGAIVVYGGTFQNWNPANNVSEGTGTSFVAEGYCAALSGTSYTVQAHAKAEAVVENNVAPTCTVTGSYDNVVYCVYCSAELSRETVTVDALGHTAGETVVENEVAATCTADGSYDNVVYCSVCDAEISRETTVVPATGHTAGESVVENEVAADCVNAGSYDNVVYCSVCEAEISRETVTVDALGHTAGEAVVENKVDPDCENAGSYDTVVYCSVCEAEISRETTVVPATGHTAGEAVVENEVAATCTADGSYDNVVYCSVCDAELSRETVTVAALGHDYTAVVTAPTCTAAGYTTYTCACGDTYVADEVAALGHTAGEAVIENKVEATAENDGSYDTVVYCSVCDAELSRDTTIVPALGHTAGEAVIENEVKATCTTAGSYDSVVYCVDCGKELSRETITVDALGHNYKTVNGVRSCSACGEMFTGFYDGYLFQNGSLYTGIYGERYYLNGVMQKAYQLVEFNGDIYFIYDGHNIAKNCTLYLGEKFVSGKTFAGTDRAIQPGYYTFDADGKLIVPEIKNGVVDDYLYINDVKMTRYQLVNFGGNYYFVNDNDKVAKNCRLYLSNNYVDAADLPEGLYEFDAEGKMIFKNGVEDDYLYVNGIKQTRYQLVEFEGNYYFINDGDKIAKNCKLYLSETYVDAAELPAGYYVFDEQGRMQIMNGVYDGFLYVDGVKQLAYQLVECNGAYYFINDGHKVAMNCRIYLSARFVEGTDFAVGYYNFDADGKMIIK